MKISNIMKIKQQDGSSFEDVKISYIEPNYCTKEGDQNTLDKKDRVSSDYPNGDYSHVEGNYNKAMGIASHAEGGIALLTLSEDRVAALNKNVAPRTIIGQQGDEITCVGSLAYGDASHAEGYKTSAIGNVSHSEGFYTIARGKNQHVQGKYNIEDTEEKYSHIVGNGSGNSNRSNAHTLDWDGNAWFAGDITTGGTAESSTGTVMIREKIWDINDLEEMPLDENGNFTLTSINFGSEVLNKYTYLLIKVTLKSNISEDGILTLENSHCLLWLPSTGGRDSIQKMSFSYSDSNSASQNQAITFYRREFSTIDPEGLKISNGYRKSGATVATVIDNTRYIPIEIYGVK